MPTEHSQVSCVKNWVPICLNMTSEFQLVREAVQNIKLRSQHCHVLGSGNSYLFKECNTNVYSYGKVVMGQVQVRSQGTPNRERFTSFLDHGTSLLVKLGPGFGLGYSLLNPGSLATEVQVSFFQMSKESFILSKFFILICYT